MPPDPSARLARRPRRSQTPRSASAASTRATPSPANAAERRVRCRRVERRRPRPRARARPVRATARTAARPSGSALDPVAQAGEALPLRRDRAAPRAPPAGRTARTRSRTDCRGTPTRAAARRRGGRRRSTRSWPGSRARACTRVTRSASSARRRGSGPGCAAGVVAAPGAPHGPLPWSRRVATTSATVVAAGASDRRATHARVAASRWSAIEVGMSRRAPAVEVGARRDVGRRASSSRS